MIALFTHKSEVYKKFEQIMEKLVAREPETAELVSRWSMIKDLVTGESCTRSLVSRRSHIVDPFLEDHR